MILGTAHGSNVPGKRSPDGKFREYKFSREVIAMLKPRLESHGITVFVDMPSDEVPRPGNTELSLRCKYVNGICSKFGKENCVYVSIHVNAAGSDGQWHDARGFAVYVSRSCSAASRPRRPFFSDVRDGAPNAQGGLTLALLMLGVLADNHHAALALDDLAFFADRFHRRTDFHGYTSLG